MSFSATEEIMKSCHLTSNEFMSRLFHQLTDISPVIFFFSFAKLNYSNNTGQALNWVDIFSVQHSAAVVRADA